MQMEVEFEGSRIIVDSSIPLQVGDIYMQKRRNTGWYLDEVKYAEEVDNGILKGRFVIGTNGWGETQGNYKVIEILDA